MKKKKVLKYHQTREHVFSLSVEFKISIRNSKNSDFVVLTNSEDDFSVFLTASSNYVLHSF